MSRTHAAHALLAALALLCAQGCRNGTGAPRASAPTQGPPSAPAAAPPTPAPDAPPFPARQRGPRAFQPFVNLSGGRRFESREVGRKPLRKDLKVSADYPVLLGDEGAAAREFNRRARAFVLDEVTPYLDDTPDREKEKDPVWKDAEEYHDVSHAVVYASDELVSVLFYIEGYRWGAGHGFHEPVAFNFDLKSGREIKLRHLFRPGTGYLRRIATLCHEDLKRQFGRGYPGGEGTAVEGDGLKQEADNFKSWVVTRDGLVFIFEEYRVVSYADGEPKVLIPFDSLREFIDPRGPLARLAAHE